MNIEEFTKRFEEIEETEIDDVDINDFEEKVYALEEDVEEAIHSSFGTEEIVLLKLMKKIIEFKKDNDFYNAEDELNRMFPNRGDDDFDEESTSYESVFGND